MYLNFNRKTVYIGFFINRWLLIVFVLLIASCASRNIRKGEIAIIPLPLELTKGQGYFIINKNAAVSVENEEQLKIAANFFKKFDTLSGWIPEHRIH